MLKNNEKTANQNQSKFSNQNRTSREPNRPQSHFAHGGSTKVQNEPGRTNALVGSPPPPLGGGEPANQKSRPKTNLNNLSGFNFRKASA
jgi:hypothetical protein